MAKDRFSKIKNMIDRNKKQKMEKAVPSDAAADKSVAEVDEKRKKILGTKKENNPHKY